MSTAVRRPACRAACRGDREAGRGLAGMPVVCCSLHSQVAPVCAGIGEGIRYRLPPAAGRSAARFHRRRPRVEGARPRRGAVAVRSCIDGDVHASRRLPLSWTKAAGFDAAVCDRPRDRGDRNAPRSRRARGGRGCGHVRALGGQPVVAARVSDADDRERHRGMSATQAILELCVGEVLVAVDDSERLARGVRAAALARGARTGRGSPRSSPPDTPPVASHAA